ncbi:MAG: hypothetical protein HOZ81_48170 [Streptomyces sp.]|nr:hypothetical protein [Streptomyces sp.]
MASSRRGGGPAHLDAEQRHTKESDERPLSMLSRLSPWTWFPYRIANERLAPSTPARADAPVPGPRTAGAEAGRRVQPRSPLMQP